MNLSRAQTTQAALVAAAMVGASLSVPHAVAQEGGSRFSIGVLPDTQFYSRYSTPDTGNLAQARYGSEPFQSQTQWLADHHEELNMEFATHLGDVVDQADVDAEWEVADKAMATLDASELNYSVLPGNHDLAGHEPFKRHFGPERARTANTTFQERYSAPHSDSEYHIFEAEGQQYLVLALAWRADDAALNWAQQVIDSHPDLPVILTSHEVLNINGAGEVYYSEDYGQGLWEKFIRRNDQIFLTLGGHHHGAGYRVDKNDSGHDVVSILQDYQMAYQGGNGLLGVLEFDLSGKELELSALSPWVAQKPYEELTQFDQLTADNYHIPMDFQARFAGFDSEWKPGTGKFGDLAGQARGIVEAGYRPYEITADDMPLGPNDYVKNESTVFHWRPGRTTDAQGKRLAEGDIAGRGSVIPDVAGQGHLYRELGGVGARVTYSADHHPLSADAGSLYWSDPAGKLSTAEFKSAAGADINDVDTTQGYTFETFVKVPKDFNGSAHGWGNAITRDSSIADLVEGSTDTDPTVMFGISNLRELRWWAEPKEGSGSTVWSHEVPTDEWMHIAVVNDPHTDTVEMFINGAPILRNAAGAEGLLPRDLRWVMGAGRSDNRPQDPWYGWIGETRLTSGVLGEDEWLTARSHDASQPEGPGGEPGQPAEPGSSGASSSSKAGAVLGVLAGIIGLVGAGAVVWPIVSRVFGDVGSSR